MNNAHTIVTANNYNQISQFQQDKLAWENAICGYNGPDPLELWFNFICWYEQNMSLDPERKYEEVLSKCLSMYEYKENFKQDIRMVKLWMKYIDLKPHPLNLYQVLYQRSVGTQCAVFYIGWAKYFDITSSFKQAESVYNLGFAAKAHPIEELQAAHAKFRLSVAQRMLYDDSSAATSKKRPSSQLSMSAGQQQQQQQQTTTATASAIKTPAMKKQKTDPTETELNYINSATSTTTPPMSEPCDLNNSANMISSSLNSVYDCDDDATLQSCSENVSNGVTNSIYDALRINIPSNFIRSAKNNDESWSGALFLEEPYEPNKICKYPKFLVYPAGHNVEFSPEEIRARKYANRIAAIKEVNALREEERLRVKAERIRIEKERMRLEQEQERYRQQILAAEQERQRQEQERIRMAEQERQRQIEYENMRIEQERQRVAEFNRMRMAELEKKRLEAEQIRQQQQQSINNYGHLNGYGQQSNNNNATVTNMVTNPISDDFEEQIEASTIRFSTGNGLKAKPKTLTIKYRKEKPNEVGAVNAASSTTATTATTTNNVPSTPKPTKPRQPKTSATKTKKEKKQNKIQTNGSLDQFDPDTITKAKYDNNPEAAAVRTNNIDDANLLLSISNMHSSSNDDSSYSYSSSSAPVAANNSQEQSYLQNDDSYSNSDFNQTYPYSAENSNCNFPLSSSTPLRRYQQYGSQQTDAGYSSKTPTPHNFKILKKRTSNISYQNDDSMCSFSTDHQNSYFATENNEELRQKRLDKALATIEQHMAKPFLDPFNSELCKALLTKIGFPSREHSNTYKLVNTPLPKLSNTKMALLANVPFSIEKEVGRGSYGCVYKASNADTNEIVALKYQKPPNNWELYICTEVRKKITNHDVLLGFMDISTAIVAPNASIFVTEFSQYGSLLDINNRIRQGTTKVMHESLVMHFSSQILDIVNHLHSCKIIHADIKPDNFLLMKIPNPNSHVPTIRLIDFGCAIDMNFFDDKTQFKKRIETDGFTCSEMQDGRPWSYQTDIFCIAGTIHVMLFGEYMQPVKKFGTWDIKTKLPRYLKKHIWSDLFTKFLNIKDVDHLPNLNDIKLKIDDELYNMDSELHSQIRTLSNILHRR